MDGEGSEGTHFNIEQQEGENIKKKFSQGKIGAEFGLQEQACAHTHLWEKRGQTLRSARQYDISFFTPSLSYNLTIKSLL